MAAPNYRKDSSFAKKYLDELPSPQRVLKGVGPASLWLLYREARIAVDRYRQALAEASADEKGIENIRTARL